MVQQILKGGDEGRFYFKPLFLLPEDIKRAYRLDSIQKNHYALNIIVLLIAVIEPFNIARVLFFSRSGLGTLNNRIYFGMYCTLLICGLLAIGVERLMKHRETALTRLYTATAFFWMTWHVLLNGYDLRGTGSENTIIFLTALLGISVFIQLKPSVAFCVYLSTYLLFLVVSAPSLGIGMVINTSISVIVAFFISFTRYNHTVTELTQELEIKRINEQLKKEQEGLRISLEKHEIIMEQSNEVIFEWDIVKDALMFSHIGEVEFHCPAMIAGAYPWIMEASGLYEADKHIFMEMLQRCKSSGSNGESEFRIKNKSGRFVWYRARIFLQYDSSGLPIYGIGVLSDIDKQKNHLDKLTIRLQIDPLTGVLNKLAFQSSVQDYASNSPEDKSLAMFMLDLDNFKTINDEYGHPYGDYVLQETSKAMRMVFRDTDYLGRLGGDEFAVVMPNVKDTELLSAKAEQLLKEISKIEHDNHNISMSCSIGISVIHSGGFCYEDFYKSADLALYEAKRLGKGCHYIRVE